MTCNEENQELAEPKNVGSSICLYTEVKFTHDVLQNMKNSSIIYEVDIICKLFIFSHLRQQILTSKKFFILYSKPV